MNPFIVALTLLVTIAAALGLGVMLGYAAVSVILRAMHRPHAVAERALAATEASSGD